MTRHAARLVVRSSHLVWAAAALLAATVGVVAQRQGPGPNGPVPLPNLTVAERQTFDEGARTFAKDYTVAEGLGPVFNDESCNDCHRGGGDTNRTVTRFGKVDADAFDNLGDLGGSLVQARGIGSVSTNDGSHDFQGESVPGEATVRTRRKSQALFGLGLVDAVPDDTFVAIAEAELAADASTAGRVQQVFDVTTGGTVVGRFGWKAQVPTLRAFAGDALLNEMGITSPGFRDEVCPQGDCDALAFNPAPALNDDGRDATALTDFMVLLAPPLRAAGTDESARGEAVFGEAGCAACHRPSLTTGSHPIRAIDRRVFFPYSDFLLHDMGALGDGIAQGVATGRQMRTAPLWGLRLQTRYLHDGSATTLEDAIRRHDGQGAAARRRVDALSEADRAALLAFLRAL